MRMRDRLLYQILSALLVIFSIPYVWAAAEDSGQGFPAAQKVGWEAYPPFQRGVTALLQRQYEDALKAFDEIEEGIGSFQVDLLAMTSPASSQQFRDALQQLEQDAEVRPDDAVLRFYLGRLRRFIGVTTVLVESYVQGEHQGTRGAEERTKWLTQATDDFARVLALDPTHHQAAYYLAKTYSLLDRYPEAVAAMEQAHAQHPGTLEYQWYLGWMHLAAGQFSKAEQIFQTILDESAAPSPTLLQCRLIRQQLELLRDGNEQYPDGAPALLHGMVWTIQYDGGRTFTSDPPLSPEQLEVMQQSLDKEFGLETQLGVEPHGQLITASLRMANLSTQELKGFMAGDRLALGLIGSEETDSGCSAVSQVLLWGKVSTEGFEGTQRVSLYINQGADCSKPKTVVTSDQRVHGVRPITASISSSTQSQKRNISAVNDTFFTRKQRFLAGGFDALFTTGLGLIPAAGLPLAAIYWLLRDGLFQGQSLGKRIFHLRVVHQATGQPCSVWRSCGRNALWIVPIVSLVFLFEVIWCVSRGADGRHWGDRLADTRVIPPPAGGLPA